MTYSVVAGDVPPGMVLDPALGQVKGLAPDADTTYTFTVRATDYHGKYADNIFRIKVRGACISHRLLEFYYHELNILKGNISV